MKAVKKDELGHFCFEDNLRKFIANLVLKTIRQTDRQTDQGIEAHSRSLKTEGVGLRMKSRGCIIKSEEQAEAELCQAQVKLWLPKKKNGGYMKTRLSFT